MVCRLSSRECRAPAPPHLTPPGSSVTRHLPPGTMPPLLEVPTQGRRRMSPLRSRTRQVRTHGDPPGAPIPADAPGPVSLRRAGSGPRSEAPCRPQADGRRLFWAELRPLRLRSQSPHPGTSERDRVWTQVTFSWGHWVGPGPVAGVLINWGHVGTDVSTEEPSEPQKELRPRQRPNL